MDRAKMDTPALQSAADWFAASLLLHEIRTQVGARCGRQRGSSTPILSVDDVRHDTPYTHVSCSSLREHIVRGLPYLRVPVTCTYEWPWLVRGLSWDQQRKIVVRLPTARWQHWQTLSAVGRFWN